ncbi:MAG: ribbon-helix-helix domain-containing protein [Candidatus Hodarchaeota archaeon]
MPTKHTTIALPTEMISYIDRLIENTKILAKYGYSSRADLIRAAVTNHLEKLEKELDSEPSD